jgi:hypothetical protein
MSLIDTAEPPLTRPKRRPSIPTPDGDSLDPRAVFAENIGASEKTVARMNLPTTYVAGIAYVKRNASLQIIANGVKRRNQPSTRRRK